MTVEELIAEVVALLQREGRVSYRMLKRRFSLDDDYLEDLKEEVIYAKRLAVDEDSKVLVWIGGSQVTAPRTVTPPIPQSPASYTPPHLAERILAEQAAMETRGATDGERKTITALFADLKGSTALIEGLDPEEARAIIDPALQLMMDAVHRYEGYVAQALGDGIFACSEPRLRMKIIPSGHSTPPCACKTRCGGMLTSCGQTATRRCSCGSG